MLMKFHKANKQRGIGLLELMLSIAIISILLLMATRYFQSANQSQRISNTLSIVGGIIGAEINYAMSNNGSYSTDPAALLLPANILVNPWGGKVTLTAPNNSSVQIVMAGVDSNACNNLIKPSISGASATCAAGTGTTSTLTVTYQ